MTPAVAGRASRRTHHPGRLLVERVVALGVLLVSTLAAAADTAPTPSGDLRAERFAFQYAVYLPAKSGKNLAAVAEARRAAQAAFLEPVDRFEEGMSLPALMIGVPAIAEYAPMDVDALRYFGRGLSEDQTRAASEAPEVVVLTFATDRTSAMRSHAAAARLLADLARELGGFVWDEDTRELFSSEEWGRRRTFSGDGPLDVRDHVTMHAYRDGELIRIVTLGMGKFGLPDLAVSGVASRTSESMGNLVNLACQTLLERGRLERDGVLSVDIAKLRNPSARESQSTNLLSGSTGRADLAVRYIAPEKGDPDNRILALDFGGQDAQVAQEKLIDRIYGSEDSISYVRHDDGALQEASRRAKKRLLELKPRVVDGFDPNESLLVKAPFATSSGGNEWMWVEVVVWKADQIDGILANDPYDVPELEAGSRVRVEQDEVFDYIYTHSDGTTEGNETGKVIERISTETRRVTP